jgi:hypothetical protein
LYGSRCRLASPPMVRCPSRWGPCHSCDLGMDDGTATLLRPHRLLWCGGNFWRAAVVVFPGPDAPW